MLNSIAFGTCLLLTMLWQVRCQSSAGYCEPKEVDDCTRDIKSLYNSQDGPVILKNEAELSQLCRHQENALRCINGFVERCLPEPHRNVFNNLTSAVQDFVNDFCMENSEIRKVYIKHLSCFNKLAGQVHHCVSSLQEWNKKIEKTRTRKDEVTRQACCRYDYAMSCMGTVVRNGCPAEAADLFDGMIRKIKKEFYQIANCDQLYYVMSECSGGSASSISSLSSLYLLAVLTSILIKFW